MRHTIFLIFSWIVVVSVLSSGQYKLSLSKFEQLMLLNSFIRLFMVDFEKGR